jgi:tetratricopeptide (TPR) repeat protein
LIDEWDEANTWAEKALEVGEKTKNYGAVAIALANKASFLTDTGRIDDGLPLWERAMNVALQHEKYEEALFAMHNLSIYTYPRDLAKAMEFVIRRLDLARRLNLKISEIQGLSWLSFLHWFRGDWTAATADLEKAFETSERLGILPHGFLLTSRGMLLLSIGDLEQAETDLQRDLGLLKEEPKITRIVAVHLGLGLLRLEQGRTDEAKAHFETCVNAFKEWEFTTMPLWHIETLLHLTSIYARRGELEKGREASQWAKGLSETLRSDAGLAMASQAEASVLHTSGDGQGAADALLKSLSFWEKAGWPYYHAEALLEYSEAIKETNRDESRKRLEESAEIFRKLGARRDLERAEAKLGQK